MYQDGKIYLGKAGDEKVCILPQMANRHGMICGATGTGKTVTLKVLAESFSDAGVPVFLADVKGDLAGMSQGGTETEDMARRLDSFGLREDGFAFKGYPTQYWDIYGQSGLPLRTTVTEMGPLLLAQILGLNDTQEAVLTVIFKIADDEGLLLIDTKDLNSMLMHVSENSKEYSLRYGNIAKQSVGAIQRALLALEQQGGELFMGEPALNISDWLTRDPDGHGTINILDCQKLILNPTMYSTFMLWMLSELFETLPEVGDAARPKMVFFFDEAHLLFDMASKELLQKIEQVVKLIRSKGVGIYFITQNPSDIPGGVLAQLGNKVQHALHAYTPAEQRGVKAAADSFRPNPAFDTREAIESLGIGEALVSVLDEQGVPGMVQRTKILPPQSQMGAIEDERRAGLIRESLLYTRYAEMVDRDSAYEFLERMRLTQEENERKAEEEKIRQKEEALAEKERMKEEAAAAKEQMRLEREAERQRLKEEVAQQRAKDAADRRKKSEINKVVSSATGTIGRELGKSVGGAVGGRFGKTLGGNVGASLGRGMFKTLFKL
ncbi:MAG: DUF853 family protein [Lachnospiraceae bacterium]|nr:DUF853 family protein [Lachnospiraceae bacterium]